MALNLLSIVQPLSISLLFFNYGALPNSLAASKILLIIELGKLCMNLILALLQQQKSVISLGKDDFEQQEKVFDMQKLLLNLEGVSKVTLAALLMALSQKLFYYAAAELPAPLLQIYFPFSSLFTFLALQYSTTSITLSSDYSSTVLLLFGFGLAISQLSATSGSFNSIAVLATGISSLFATAANSLIYREAVEGREESIWIKKAQVSLVSILIWSAMSVSEWEKSLDLSLPIKLLIAISVLGSPLFVWSVENYGLLQTSMVESAGVIPAIVLGLFFFPYSVSWGNLGVGIGLIGVAIHHQFYSLSNSKYTYALANSNPLNSHLSQNRINLIGSIVIFLYYYSQIHIFLEAPTIVIADLKLNEHMRYVNKESCGWSWFDNKRNSTQAAFGWREPERGISTYPVLTNSDQFSLDDLIYTRVVDYPKLLPSYQIASADFILLPTYSVILGNGFGCMNQTYLNETDLVVSEIRSFVDSLPERNYPRVVFPISTIRSGQNTHLLTQAITSELGEKVIVVSIESSPLWWRKDSMKYVIDVPYPGRFHYYQDETEQWKREKVPDFYLKSSRPHLLHFGGAFSHPWQGKDEDPINGFKLRRALKKTLDAHQNATRNSTDPTEPSIIFDNFANFRKDPIENFEDFVSMYDHMATCVFALQPAGDTPSRKAFYESLNSGSIPVIFRKTSYHRLFPSSPELDPSLFTVFIDENEIINGEGFNIIERLAAIPKAEILTKQKHIASITRKLQWSYPPSDIVIPLNSTRLAQRKYRKAPSFDSDAFGMVLKELATIKAGKWKSRVENGKFDDSRPTPGKKSSADYYDEVARV